MGYGSLSVLLELNDWRIPRKFLDKVVCDWIEGLSRGSEKEHTVRKEISTIKYTVSWQ